MTEPAIAPAAVVASAEGARAERRPSVLRNMAHLMSSQAVSWVLGLVASVVSARFLGPAAIGEVRLAGSLWLLAQTFVALGTTRYLTLEMAKDPARAHGLTVAILHLRLAAFGVATAVMFAYAIATDVGATMMSLLVILGVAALLMTIAEVYSAALIGLEQMSYPALSGVVSKSVYTALLVGVLLLGGGVVAATVTMAVHALLAAALLRSFYRRFATAAEVAEDATFRSIIRDSSGFFAATAIVMVYLQTDTIVIAALVGDETLGWYTAADVLTGSLLFVPTILMATLFPVLGRVHSLDEAAATDVVRRTFSALVPIGVAVGFGTVVIAEPVCVLLYGEEYRRSGAVLAVFGLMIPFIYSTMVVATVAMATGRRRFWNTVMVVAVVATIGLDIVLVPLTDRLFDNGAIGGAASYVLTEAGMLAIGMWKIVPVTRSARSLVRIAKTVFAGALMVAAAWPLRGLFVAVPTAVGAAVFLSAAVALGIPTDEERAAIRQMAVRLGIRCDARPLTADITDGDAADVVDETRGGPRWE